MNVTSHLRFRTTIDMYQTLPLVLCLTHVFLKGLFELTTGFFVVLRT